MNDVEFLEASRKLAERMIASDRTKPEDRIVDGFRLVLARSPKPVEEEILTKALADFETVYKNDPAAAQKFLLQGESPIRAGVDKRELAAYTAVANLMFNMDAAVNKE